jgi:hypothetical protein
VWFTKPKHIYTGFIQSPVYIESTNSIAFIDCKHSCSFIIFDLTTESVIKKIEFVENAGLTFYSPDEFFIISKNGGQNLIKYSLKTDEVSNIDKPHFEFAEELHSNNYIYDSKTVIPLNPFMKKFTQDKLYCSGSEKRINIPNNLGKEINFTRKVKQLGLAGTEVKYYLEVNKKERFLREGLSICILDAKDTFYIVEQEGIEKLEI